jgi:MFS transporter, Spinster family, sphingosine-1-phosphate transporter
MTQHKAPDKRYLLALLLIILAFNYVDRLALGILLQSIKTDFQLSDTQLGFMSGIAFALFYAIMGIPIARWADRGNRVVIIAVTTALWSVAVIFCGMAGNFLQLLLVRIGVAVGEAGCIPPAHSLIADHFSRGERARATATYMLGTSVSMVIGYFVAGWLNEMYGWRMTFILLGAPGVVLAVLVATTLREPRRDAARHTSASEAAVQNPQPEIQPTLRETLVTLWSNRSFRHLLLGYSIASFFAYGISQWKPAFFVRSYGMSTGDLGMAFALVSGLGGMFGTYLGGRLASRFASQNEPLQLKAIAIAYASFGVISCGIYLSPTAPMAFAFMGVAIIGVSMTYGPLFATIQTMVPPRMRAMAVALIFFFVNLVGMGLGPLAAGMLSDFYQAWTGEQSLRYALLTLCPGYVWAAFHLWRGSQTVSSDIRAVQQGAEAPGEKDAVLPQPGRSELGVQRS